MKRWLTIVALVLFSPAALANKLLDPLEGAGPDAASDAFPGVADGIHICNMCWCKFAPGERLDCGCGGEGTKVDGEWLAKGRHMYGTMGNSCKFHYEVTAISQNFVRFYSHDEGGGQNLVGLYCGGEQNACGTVDGPTIKVTAGAEDSSLFDSVVADYTQPEMMDMASASGDLWFDGGQAKKPRKVSEIWYADGFEKQARELADSLEKKIGPVEPQAWEWGGPYDIYLIVGAHKVGESPMTVKVLDGHCIQGKADCKNPLFDKVLAALPKTATVSEKGKSKKPRTSTQVWYQAGKQAQAQSLATGVLKAWVAPADVQQWKWGGKFDVLIVVGPPK